MVQARYVLAGAGLFLTCTVVAYFGFDQNNKIMNSPKEPLATFSVPPTISHLGPTETPRNTAIPTDTPDITATFTSTYAPAPSLEATATFEPTATLPAPTPDPNQIKFGVIGDFGSGNDNEKKVRDMLDDYEVDFVTSVGDNCYIAFTDCPGNLERNWGDLIDSRRLLPTFGNHDAEWDFYELFTLPKYFGVAQEPVHMFFLNAYEGEFSPDSQQGQWLKQELEKSDQPWQIVFLHPAPYSSGELHGSYELAQWPFAEWGADAVIAGHEHNYERLHIDGIPYIVNGAGGGPLYNFGELLPESKKRIKEHGAMMVTVSHEHVSLVFADVDGNVLDTIVLTGEHGKGGLTPIPYTSTPVPSTESLYFPMVFK
jgi:hypothetical protein